MTISLVRTIVSFPAVGPLVGKNLSHWMLCSSMKTSAPGLPNKMVSMFGANSTRIGYSKMMFIPYSMSTWYPPSVTCSDIRTRGHRVMFSVTSCSVVAVFHRLGHLLLSAALIEPAFVAHVPRDLDDLDERGVVPEIVQLDVVGRPCRL